jgi:ribonuclease P/MRP protein subunit RPP40
VVPHDLLVTKLINIGICERTLHWIVSFLSNRTQRVVINNKLLSDVHVTSGVIQGSVLGPLLFVLYINDLSTVCKNCTVKLFADDVKLYKRITSLADRVTLQLALSTWAHTWKLNISIDKCNFLQLGYNNATVVYNIDSHVIVPCNSVKDLGILVESNLKPSAHCSNIVLKANARAKLILKAFLSCDYKSLARALAVYVRPLLEYCSPAWSPHNKGDIDLIENVQRAFTRKVYYMCNLQYVSYNERLLFLGLERLELRRLHADVVFMYKLVKGFVSCNLSHELNFVNNGTTRGHRFKLFISRCNKLVLSSFFLNRVLPAWNNLPDNCFDCTTVSSFKTNLTKIDFSQYFKSKL